MKILILAITIVLIGFFLYLSRNNSVSNITSYKLTPKTQKSTVSQNTPTNPLSISALRARSYKSTLTVVQNLTGGPNYNAYLITYLSDGLKIYGYLTVPIGNTPSSGWPAILFNHGYISPPQYSTVDSYSSYINIFASQGYVVFKPDYRGNGNSQGEPEQSYISPAYIIDDLNALSALKAYKEVNAEKIGIFGHSMGGNITLHDLVIEPNDFKAAVIWGGVVGSYSQILNWWKERIAAHSISGND